MVSIGVRRETCSVRLESSSAAFHPALFPFFYPTNSTDKMYTTIMVVIPMTPVMPVWHL